MKKVNPPGYPDIDELDLLAANTRLASHPKLKENSGDIKLQYQKYSLFGGNPWKVESCCLPASLQQDLKNHYKNPPKGRLKVLAEFREKLSPNLCPMCGGLGLGTLDHYLPKSDFAQFSIFSQNLIPACSCNSRRGTTIKGDFPPKRIIHPYFDDFLEERLFEAAFNGSYKTPDISVCVINSDHPNIDILEFHLKEVILKNNILGWLEKSWSDLRRRPHDLLEIVLPEGNAAIDKNQLNNSLIRYLKAKDMEYGTPNNWWSIFYSGLKADQNRLDRLAHEINISRT